MITLERLREVLDYNPDTGIFIWKIWVSFGIKIGTVAGGKNKSGYIKIVINGKAYVAHRLAWFYYYGEWPKTDLDHKDRNKSNNILSNLREATKRQNNLNTCYRRKDGGDIGVYYRADRGKWRARIKVNGKYISLGCFDTEEEALYFRKQAETKYNGEFCRPA